MKEVLRILILLLIGVLAQTQAQQVNCDPSTVTWHPHPTDCTLYLICFHGVVHTLRCAPGLHFNRNTTECMLPDDAQCILDYRCPPFDDPTNPIFLPNEDDCRGYFLCVNGIPNERWCIDGLWWDVTNNWCTFPDQVTCDNRTLVTPPPPTTTSTTTITTTTTTNPPESTTTGLPPNIGQCTRNIDLFDGPDYIKSYCLVERAANYESSRTQCQSFNMNLFIVDSTLVHILFHNTTMLHVGNRHPTGAIIINGRRNTVLDIWNVQNPDDTVQGLLYENINWVNTSSVNGRTSGPCLSYSGIHGGGYQALGFVCTATRWFVCEHGFRSTTPDPTEPTIIPTTTPSLTTTTTAGGGGGDPNLAACAQREDLFNNGTYLKSLCIISTQQNYANAEQNCRTNGMELFVLDSSPLQRAFRTAITRLLSAHPRGFVWINGRVDDECGRWFNFDPTRRIMWNGVHFVQTDDVIGRVSGECLRYTSQFSVGEANWQGAGAACNSASWFVCEYLT